MKGINVSDIGLIIGFYDDKNILQIASIYEVMNDYIVTDLNERVAKKDIIDVGFVDLNKHEQLKARIKELESAERTLNNLGYRNLGGSLWKPPIGKKPDFSLIDRLNKRIEDLDLERKKAFKAGSDYFNQLQEVEKHCNELAQKIKELESQSHINEIKAQGVSEAIKGFRTFALSNNVNLTCEDFDEYLCEQVKKLRTKHD